MNTEQQQSHLTSASGGDDLQAALNALYDSAPYEDEPDLTCESCGGSGADRWEAWNPCGACDGEGYRWWE